MLTFVIKTATKSDFLTAVGTNNYCEVSALKTVVRVTVDGNVNYSCDFLVMHLKLRICLVKIATRSDFSVAAGTNNHCCEVSALIKVTVNANVNDSLRFLNVS